MSELAIDSQANNYKVDLEIFSGPLDLLLHLIKEEEVDIYEIPLAKITKQYLRYVDLISNLDLEVAGEFVLMAATLIRIKTRLLLPQDETDTDEPDLREELILALVEYKKFKEAADILRSKAQIEEQIFIPPSPIEKIEGRVDLTPVTSLYDLITAYREVLLTKHDEVIHQVNQEEVSIEDRMRVIVALLQSKEYASFHDLIADLPTKVVIIVTFIAILELTRARRIKLYQALPFSDVRVYPGEMINAPVSEIDLVDYNDQGEEEIEK